MIRSGLTGAALSAFAGTLLLSACAPKDARVASVRATKSYPSPYVPGAAAVPERYQDIKPSADAWEPPYPPDYRVELEGGAVAYLVPDSTLDLVRLYLYAPSPVQPARPADAAKLRLYSALLKDGGTRKLSPAKLEDSLEFIAAGLSARQGAWQSEASFDALSRDADALLSLLGDAVREPGLDAQVFALMQRRMLEGRKHRYATPGGVMGAAYERVMQGGHPSNWLAEAGEISAARPSDLKPLAGTGFGRRGLVIGVAGRFDRAAMIARLNAFVKAFPDTAPRPAALAAPKPFKGARAPGVYLVDKPFAQTTLRLAAPGVKRPDPDYYRLAVASYIFGDGGFTSRLVLRVRSDEGLAYGVNSEVESDYNRRGTVYVGLQSKAATGAYAATIVREEMRRMARDGITDAELERARDALLKSLPSLFDGPASTARIFAQSEAWGRSPEHFKEYRKALEGMTRAEVEDAFRRYFDADSLRVIAVGPKDVLLAPDAAHGGVSLRDFGKVTEITEEELDRREN